MLEVMTRRIDGQPGALRSQFTRREPLSAVAAFAASDQRPSMILPTLGAVGDIGNDNSGGGSGASADGNNTNNTDNAPNKPLIYPGAKLKVVDGVSGKPNSAYRTLTRADCAEFDGLATSQLTDGVAVVLLQLDENDQFQQCTLSHHNGDIADDANIFNLLQQSASDSADYPRTQVVFIFGPSYSVNLQGKISNLLNSGKLKNVPEENLHFYASAIDSPSASSPSVLVTPQGISSAERYTIPTRILTPAQAAAYRSQNNFADVEIPYPPQHALMSEVESYDAMVAGFDVRSLWVDKAEQIQDIILNSHGSKHDKTQALIYTQQLLRKIYYSQSAPTQQAKQKYEKNMANLGADWPKITAAIFGCLTLVGAIVAVPALILFCDRRRNYKNYARGVTRELSQSAGPAYGGRSAAGVSTGLAFGYASRGASASATARTDADEDTPLLAVRRPPAGRRRQRPKAVVHAKGPS